MKLFECQHCGHLLFFENTRCERCGHALGYLPAHTTLSALTPATSAGDTSDRWQALAVPGEQFRFCANATHEVCNWLVPADGPDAFCVACRLNRTIPNLEDPRSLLLWRRLEHAKHRLVYGLLRLGLPVVSKHDDFERGMAFDFLAAPAPGQDGPPVLTGHAAGIITIDVAEADDVERERQRSQLVERYRTLLGHLRHEIAHHYWDRLVRDSAWLHTCRDLFGDEREDYTRALETHYARGPRPDWQQRYVSTYASAHPWEDFAETWAHYLHIVDTLETAAAFGLQIHARPGHQAALELTTTSDPYLQHDFDELMRPWLPLTTAVNSLNHSMGQPDLYPLVLSPIAVGKLRFVHGLIAAARIR